MPNTLSQHLITHKDRRLKCFGCTKMFVSYSAMVLHFELNACKVDIDKTDILLVASEDDRRREYTNPDDLNVLNCPGCTRTYRRVGDLLQHVETDACRERIDGGPLGRLLEKVGDEIFFRLALCLHEGSHEALGV